ncbi:MAG: PhoH family protein [Pseudomonadota bacterium]
MLHSSLIELVKLEFSFEPLNNSALLKCCGPVEQHLRAIEKSWDVQIIRRHQHCEIHASDLKQAELARDFLLARYHKFLDFPERSESMDDFDTSLMAATSENTSIYDAVRGIGIEPALGGGGGQQSKQLLKTESQRRYWQAMNKYDIVFGVGVAGTGKTYLAVAKAVEALTRQTVKRIVLVRPAVEAGERLGFLPGDMAQKVDPYLRPLFDALHDHLGGAERMQKAMERNQIEIAPLAYMRGRTLQNAFVILDEAQNTTPEQMKMFLTRLGWGSKMVITGDPTQIDLPRAQRSGLLEAQERLARVDEIAFCEFASTDVVRHPLVQKIVEAYA